MGGTAREALRAPGKIVLEIWRDIDERYRREAGFEPRALWVLIVAALVLLTVQFFCVTEFFSGFASIRQSLKDLPHGGLYPLLYWALANVLNYCLLPLLVIKGVYRAELRDFGLRLEGGRELWIAVAVILAAVLPLIAMVAPTEPFLRKYPFYREEIYAIGPLLLWEAAYGLQFVALEFFFRGFMLFGLARYLGSYAIFVTAIPYTMLHFTKPFPEAFLALWAGIVLGTLALRSGSLYGGVVIHLTVAWSMDLMALFQKGLFTGLK